MSKKHYSQEEKDFMLQSARAGMLVKDMQTAMSERFGVRRPINAIKFFIKTANIPIPEAIFKRKGDKTVIDLTCCKCKRVTTVTVSDTKIYTPDVIKNWTCSICKGRKE